MLLDNKITIFATNDGKENNNIQIDFLPQKKLNETLVVLEQAKQIALEMFNNYIKGLETLPTEKEMLELYNSLTIGELQK